MDFRAEGHRSEVSHLYTVHSTGQAAKGASRVRLLWGGNPGTVEGGPVPIPTVHLCRGIPDQECSRNHAHPQCI